MAFLCYVGMTRARKKLTLCCARQRMIFGKTSSNLHSRFVDEIPDECIEHTGAPESSSFSSAGSGYYVNSDWNNSRESGAYRSVAGSYQGGYAEKKRPIAPSSAKKADAPAFKTGDRVNHRAFGEGEIVKMTPMGGDHLIEVQFGDTLKKLMLRAAAPNMEKL